MVDFVEKLETAIKLVFSGQCQQMRINAHKHINKLSDLATNVERRLKAIELKKS